MPSFAFFKSSATLVAGAMVKAVSAEEAGANQAQKLLDFAGGLVASNVGWLAISSVLMAFAIYKTLKEDRSLPLHPPRKIANFTM